MPFHGSNVTRTEEEITAALLAMISFGGEAKAAASALKAERGMTIKPLTLKGWADRVYAGRYNELREKYREQIEAKLIHEFRDLAQHAVKVQHLALERAEKRLKADEDTDPARSAANLSRVAQSSTDKMLSLSGRPTSIREERNVEEILRSLASKGVIHIPEAEVVEEKPAEITQGNGHA